MGTLGGRRSQQRGFNVCSDNEYYAYCWNQFLAQRGDSLLSQVLGGIAILGDLVCQQYPACLGNCRHCGRLTVPASTTSEPSAATETIFSRK